MNRLVSEHVVNTIAVGDQERTICNGCWVSTALGVTPIVKHSTNTRQGLETALLAMSATYNSAKGEETLNSLANTPVLKTYPA